VQVYGLFSGRGSVARFAEGSGKSGLIAVVIKAYCQAFMKLPRMLTERKKIWGRRRIGRGEYRELLKKHRISAMELMLRD
jgi:hypothetical protein